MTFGERLRHNKIQVLQKAYVLSLKPGENEFRKIAAKPEAAFASRLTAYLQKNAATQFGREHDFARILSVDDYRRQVPIRDYDGFEPYIQSALAGDSKVLTDEPILVFEKTGGSTRANKYIPYTQSLRQEFERAMQPWFCDIMRKFPKLHGTRMYWSISPATQKAELSAGGIRIGGSDDTDYFGRVGKWAFQEMLAAPMDLSKISDMDAWKWASAFHLLKARDLGLISVWSPTFATNLFEYIEANWDPLLAALPKERRTELTRVMSGHSRFAADRVWPRLQLVSCWSDGISEQFLPGLRLFLGAVPIQAKGLLATEGVITTPYGVMDEGHVLNPLSHFIEFIDPEFDDKTTVLPHELIPGRRYSPVLTTGGGLYRYHLKDLVHCTGFMGGLPRLRFEGKLDKVSDMVGEKISAAQVERLIAEGRRDLKLDVRFAMLAPIAEAERRYALFVESPGSDACLQAFAEYVESGLRSGHHYDYARSLGQLAKLRVHRIQNGTRIFEDALVARGQRRGEIKATSLDTRDNWLPIFRGSPIPAALGSAQL